MLIPFPCLMTECLLFSCTCIILASSSPSMYSLEKRNPFSSPILPSDVSDLHTAGIRTEYGDHILFPEEGGNVFHRVVHAVEMLFLLRPVRFPARHGQDARRLRFRGVPDVTAHNYRRFPGQVALRHLQVVTVEVARVEVRCLSGHHLLVNQFF